MERISDIEAKQAILKKHCSPETTERDIFITDVEETLLEAQLAADRKELEEKDARIKELEAEIIELKHVNNILFI